MRCRTSLTYSSAIGRSSGSTTDEHLVDPIAVHVENFDLKAAPLELIADLRHTPQLQHHKPGNSMVGMVLFLGE